MRWSWLQNPTVTLIELLASAIAIGQSVACLGRCIYRLTQADGAQYRSARIAAAVLSLCVTVAFSVVTWSAIMTEAAMTGNHGFVRILYPGQMDLLAFVGAGMLFDDAWGRRKFSLFPCFLLVGGLAEAAVVSFFHTGPTGWVGWVTDSAPSVVIVVFMIMLIRYTRQRTLHEQEHGELGRTAAVSRP